MHIVCRYGFPVSVIYRLTHKHDADTLASIIPISIKRTVRIGKVAYFWDVRIESDHLRGCQCLVIYRGSLQ